jgi:hypothetical protein
MSIHCWLPVFCALACALSSQAMTLTLLNDIWPIVEVSYSTGPRDLVELNGIDR